MITRPASGEVRFRHDSLSEYARVDTRPELGHYAAHLMPHRDRWPRAVLIVNDVDVSSANAGRLNRQHDVPSSWQRLWSLDNANVLRPGGNFGKTVHVRQTSLCVARAQCDARRGHLDASFELAL